MTDYEKIKIFDGTQEIVPVNKQTDLLITSESEATAMSEVKMQAALAMQNPRNEDLVMTKLRKVCSFKSFAETIAFSFKLGSKLVQGETIRLAEEMARIWGNIRYYWKIVASDDEKSVVQAVAWDLETNVIASRKFSVRHWRDTQGGGYALKGERERYELIANMASRRLRALILQILPNYLIEEAKRECAETLRRDDTRDLSDKIKSMLLMFEDINVHQNMIEAYLQHEIRGISYTQLVNLGEIYRNIKNGIAKVEDVFKPVSVAKSERPPHPEAEDKPSVKKGKEDKKQKKISY